MAIATILGFINLDYLNLVYYLNSFSHLIISSDQFMTKSSNSTLKPFDHEIERTFRRLRNLVEERVSPKRERPEIEETPIRGAANIAGTSNGAVVGAIGAKNPRRTLMEYA